MEGAKHPSIRSSPSHLGGSGSCCFLRPLADVMSEIYEVWVDLTHFQRLN